MSSELLPDACALSPVQASRSREKESKVSKAQALFALGKISLFCKKCVDREPFQCEQLFSSARIFSTVTKVQRTELNLLPLVLDRELKDLFLTTNASLALLTLMFLNINRLFLTAVPDKVILSVMLKTPEPVLLRLPILIVLLSYGLVLFCYCQTQKTMNT